jgi:putative DNA methylase
LERPKKSTTVSFWHDRANAKSLYADGDLTLAAYATALQVVTAYASIDRQPLDRDLYRKVAKGETTMLRELVEYASRVRQWPPRAEGFPREMWRASAGFYVRMLDLEAKGATKVADFPKLRQEFRLRRLRLAHGFDRCQRRGEILRRRRRQRLGPQAAA